VTDVIENIVAAVIGLALVVYLAYALVRPERF
jgi:K+-transporting ATPase KdpF subunit